MIGRDYNCIERKVGMTKHSAGVMKTIGNFIKNPITKSVTRNTVMGAGVPVGAEYVLNGGLGGEWDAKRIGNAALNTAIGASASHLLGKGETLKSLGAVTMLPAKDALLSGIHTMRNIDSFLKEEEKPEKVESKWPLYVTLGALGLGGLGLTKYLMSKDPAAPRMKVKLPGDPNDPNSITEMDVPIEHVNMTRAMKRVLGKDLRKQVHAGIKSRTMKIDPYTRKKIPYDVWLEKYGDDDAMIQDENPQQLALPNRMPKSAFYKCAMQGLPPPLTGKLPPSLIPGPPTLKLPEGSNTNNNTVGVVPLENVDFTKKLEDLRLKFQNRNTAGNV